MFVLHDEFVTRLDYIFREENGVCQLKWPRLSQIPYALAFAIAFDFLLLLLGSTRNVEGEKKKTKGDRSESTLMENWRGGRHFFDDRICLFFIFRISLLLRV